MNVQLSYTSLRTSIRVVAEGKECGRRRTEIDERALVVAVSVTWRSAIIFWVLSSLLVALPSVSRSFFCAWHGFSESVPSESASALYPIIGLLLIGPLKGNKKWTMSALIYELSCTVQSSPLKHPNRNGEPTMARTFELTSGSSINSIQSVCLRTSTITDYPSPFSHNAHAILFTSIKTLYLPISLFHIHIYTTNPTNTLSFS